MSSHARPTHRKRSPWRTGLFVLLTAGGLVGAFAALQFLLPDPPVPTGGRPVAARELPVPHNEGGLIGDTEGIVLTSHDPVTGRLATRIQIDSYRRLPGETVEVGGVVAESFGRDGRRTVLESPGGEFNVGGEIPVGETLDETALGQPETGRLDDVVIRMYAAYTDREPELTLRVDNIAFDLVRHRFATADTTIDGQSVEAEMVPVIVRGRQLDFDGRGLVIGYDPVDRRPTLIRVANGGRIVYKPQEPILPDFSPRAVDATTAADELVEQPVAGRPLAVQLAAADGATALQAVAEENAVPFTPYRATFERGVTVDEGRQTILEAATLEALFPLTARSLRSPSQEEPEPTPAQPERPAMTPTTRAAPATRPATPTAPAKPEPLVVTWEGELRVEESFGELQPLVSAEDMRVRAGGDAARPLVFRRQGAEARGSTLTFDAGRDELRLLPGATADRVTLVEPAGSTIVTGELLVRPEAGRVIALGRSQADLISEPGEPMTKTAWTDRAELTFAATKAGRRIKAADLSGNVTVTRPDLELAGKTLSLGFDPKVEGNEALRRVQAKGDVTVQFPQQGKETIHLAGQSMELDMPSGPSGRATAALIGQVVARDGQQNLTADRLAAALVPDGEDATALESLEATGNVRGTDADGRKIAAEKMTVVGADQSRLVTLIGTTERPAVAEAQEGTLRAPRILFNEATEGFTVPSAGTLTGVREVEGKPQPFKVAWSKQAVGDGENVTAEGDVTLTTRTTDGADVVTRGQTLQVALRGAAADAESRLALAQIDFFGEIVADAQVLSAEGTVVRSASLRTEKLNYQADSGVLTIPTPGRVLVRDLRPAPTEKMGTADDFRGNIAFSWGEKLVYDPQPNLVSLFGEATLVYEDPDKQQVRLVADRFDVRLIGGTQPQAEPLRAERGEASGNVRVTAGNARLLAGRVEVDLIAGILVARGTDAEPVYILNEDGTPRATARLATYRLTDGDLRLTDVATR